MYTHTCHKDVAVWLADPVAKALHKVFDCAIVLSNMYVGMYTDIYVHT
jgi:hypothetical protein